MSATSRRVVITGLGIVSPLGSDRETVWSALAAGRTGIRTIQGFDTSGLPVHIAGEVPDFNAKNLVAREHRKSLRMMARTIELAVCAAQAALEDGKVARGQLDPARFGVEFGSGLIATELPELADAARITGDFDAGRVDLAKWGTEGVESIPPLWMLKYLPNMLACHVSILHDAQGPNNTVTESDVASLLALGEAYHILLRGGADFFLVGGAESKLNPLSLVRQCLFEPISRRDDPETACRPFDRGRDGLVLGEGSCVLCVETLDHAEKRGANILAEVVGFGAAFDRRHDGDGIARALRSALDDAGIGPEVIDHINAHGLSTREADIWEARGLRKVFGEDLPALPVFAPKSYLGNLGAGGSLMELATSLLGLTHGKIPATLNYEEPDPECPVTIPAGGPRPVERSHVVKVSFTPMGQCAGLVLRKWGAS